MTPEALVIDSFIPIKFRSGAVEMCVWDLHKLCNRLSARNAKLPADAPEEQVIAARDQALDEIAAYVKEKTGTTICAGEAMGVWLRIWDAWDEKKASWRVKAAPVPNSVASTVSPVSVAAD